MPRDSRTHVGQSAQTQVALWQLGLKLMRFQVRGFGSRSAYVAVPAHLVDMTHTSSRSACERRPDAAPLSVPTPP